MAMLKGAHGAHDHPEDAIDAVRLLKADHQKVSSLFEEFEKATEQRKESIAQQICNELSVHAQIEEEIFYPAARAVLGDEDDLIDEADVEHATLKGLVGRIQQNGSSDEHFEALVKVLGEYVKHHVKEEEGEIFPKVRRSEMDLEATGAELARRKSELLKQMS
jgi:hemerythrin superfamily protein